MLKWILKKLLPKETSKTVYKKPSEVVELPKVCGYCGVFFKKDNLGNEVTYKPSEKELSGNISHGICKTCLANKAYLKNK